MKINFKNIMIGIAVLLLCVFAYLLISDSRSKTTVELENMVEVMQKLESAKEVNIITAENRVTFVAPGEVNGQATDVTYTFEFAIAEQREAIYEKAMQVGCPVKVIPVPETPWYVSYFPVIFIIGLLIFFWIFSMNYSKSGGGGKGGFARARTKLASDEKNPVKFVDVAGADLEKEELKEVVEFLKDPQKFVKLGARIPRGVLLVGPPGTGKTLLAKAVAGEAGVPFYSISGSDFVEMYVGVGASRVRDLFDTARRSHASIIFIDEIDAVGRRRGAGLGGGHDEREQTLNQLLVEMDGFGTHEGVIVIAATNRPDILDPALLRPGRFDRQVTVNYPDLAGREAILRVHVRNKPLEKNVDLSKIAQTTVGFTGADLANLLNEAALLAARRGKSLIGMPEVEEATLKVMVGTEKKNARITPEEKRKTAYHEAGHAILAHVLTTQDPVRRISIIPSGNALGYTLNPPERDRFSVYKRELEERIVMLLGGRVAEKLIYGDVSGGASNDIKVATNTARDMVTKYGMSDLLGTVRYGGEHDSDEVFLGRDFNTSRDYSEETAFLIDKEIKRIIDEGFAMAEKLLTEHMKDLHFIAEFLMKYEVMDDILFRAVMDDHADMETLDEMIRDREKRSAEENKKAAEEARREDERLRRERERLAREALGLPPLPDLPEMPDDDGEDDCIITPEGKKIKKEDADDEK